MKNPDPVKNAELSPWALAVLRDLPGVRAVAAASVTDQADAAVMLVGQRRPILVEVKRHVDAAGAHALVARALVAKRDRMLVVAETTTAGARDALAAEGIGYMDAAGNANIVMRGLIVRTGSFTAGAVIAAPKPPPTPTRLAGKAGLVAQALLLDRERAWRVGDLANVAGVSVGLAHRVLARLEKAGVVVAEGRGPAKTRRVEAPAALLDLWAEEDAEPKVRRTTAYLLGKPGKPLAVLASPLLAARGVSHAVTGVAAASLSVPVLSAVAVTEVRVSAAAAASDILAELDARPVEQGFNLVLIQGDDDAGLQFRRQVAGTWVAAATRVYLDALRDPRRGREQAIEFRRAVFGF